MQNSPLSTQGNESQSCFAKQKALAQQQMKQQNPNGDAIDMSMSNIQFENKQQENQLPETFNNPLEELQAPQNIQPMKIFINNKQYQIKKAKQMVQTLVNPELRCQLLKEIKLMNDENRTQLKLKLYYYVKLFRDLKESQNMRLVEAFTQYEQDQYINCKRLQMEQKKNKQNEKVITLESLWKNSQPGWKTFGLAALIASGCVSIYSAVEPENEGTKIVAKIISGGIGGAAVISFVFLLIRLMIECCCKSNTKSDAAQQSNI